jgi:hypothetical protein
MWRFACIAMSVLLILGNAGCAGHKSKPLPSNASSFLQEADQIELLSLDPKQSGEGDLKDGFHGWKVLGKTVIEKADTRKSVISALERGFAEGGNPKKCFFPRHAIHASHNEKTVDIIICFECKQFTIYLDNQQGEYLLISASPESVLDKALTEANVPLAPKLKW